MSKTFKSLLLTLLLITLAVPAFAQHKGINFQAVVKRPNGTYPTVSGLTVTLQILDPVTNCVLREEEHSSVNVSNGYLILNIGASTASTPIGRNPTPILSITEVMDNSTTRTGIKCVDANNVITDPNFTYIPSPTHHRKLRLRANILGDDLVADFNMRAVAFAVNAETLNGKTEANFINTTTDVTQARTNALFAPAVYDNLLNLSSSSTGALLIPAGTTGQRPGVASMGMIRFNDTTNQVEFHDGASWVGLATGATAGETNTASNQGAGLGIFKQKTGVDLEFKSLTATSNKITLTNNTNDVGIDVNVSNLGVVENLGFTPSIKAVGNAAFPAETATGSGRIVIVTDTQKVYRDGAPGTWNLIATVDYADLANKPTIDNLVPAQATHNGKFLTTNGTNVSWSTLPASGETNTASNLTGTAGAVGLFKVKSGVDLQFKKINAGSNKIALTDDTANDELDIDINQANLAIAWSQLTSVPTTLAGYGITDAVGTSDARLLPAPAVGDALKVPRLNAGGTAYELITGANFLTAYLPNQATHAGKFLTTDGAGNISWGSAGAGDFLRNGSVSMTGAFKAIDGTVAAPGISFDTEADTGFYKSAAGTVTFSGGGFGGWNFTNGSITGFGGQGAQILNSTGAGILTYRFVNDNNTGISNPAADNLGFTTGGTERIRIDSAGNVGVGTTNPLSAFHVSGSGTVLSRIETTDTGRAIQAFMRNGSYVWDQGVNVNNLGTNDYQIREDGTTVRLVVQDATGNVGIGTTSPSSLLQIGDTTVANTAAMLLFGKTTTTVQNNMPRLHQFSPNGTLNGLAIGAASTGGGIHFFTGNAASQTSLLGTGSSTEKMTILHSGEVGINTTAPDTKLHIVGTNGTTLKIVDGNQGIGKVLTSDANGVASWSNPAGTGDALTTGKLSQFAATSSVELAGVISDETGSGNLVFGTSPTIATPTFTTNITTPLILGGTSTTQTLTYRTTSGVGATGADHIFQVGNNGATEAMRILNNGNVGIGTASPTAKFNVAGNMRLSADSAAANTQLGSIEFERSTYNPGVPAASIDFWRAGNSQEGILAFSTRAQGAANSERMRIDNLGNVGIGTASPTAKLHVSGGHAFLDNTFAFRIADSTGSNYGQLVMTSANNLVLRTTAATGTMQYSLDNDVGSHRFFTGSTPTEKVRIDNNGNVGIGTTNPSGKLTVVGTQGIGNLASILQVQDTTAATTGTGGGIALMGDDGAGTQRTFGIIRGYKEDAGAGSFNGNLAFYTRRNGVADADLRMMIQGTTGNVGIGTTSPTTSLDLSNRTDAVRMPAGTDGQRPASPANGMLRYSSTSNKLEGYINGSWQELTSVASGGGFLSSSGGTLSGALTISSGGINNTGGIDNNSGGITEAGSITGVGANITGTGALTVASGGANTNLILNPNGTGSVDIGANLANYVTIRGATSTNSPVIGTAGTDANINLTLTPKGTGNTIVSSGRFGLGTLSPGYKLEVVDAATPALILRNADDDNLRNILALGRTRSSTTAPAAGFGGALDYNLEGFTDGSVVAAGSISTIWENNQTNDTTDRDSAMTFRTMSDNGISEKMRISSSGQVGVGLTNPLNVFTVRGGAYNLNQDGGLSIVNNNGSERRWEAYYNIRSNAGGVPRGALGFKSRDAAETVTSEYEHLSLLNNGNVGIGTISPVHSLHIKSAADSNGALAIDNMVATTQSSMTFKDLGATKFVIGKKSDNSFFMWDNVLGRDFLRASTAGDLILQPTAGNVGIGTTAPSSRLHVSDSSVAQSISVGISSNAIADDVTIGTLDFKAGTANTTNARVMGISDGTDELGGHLAFETRVDGGSMLEKMRILGNGNVGIGTTSPGNILHLYSSNQLQRQIIETTAGANAEPSINLKSAGNDYYLGTFDNGSGYAYFDNRTESGITHFSISGAQKVTIDGSGNLGVGTSTPNTAKFIVDGGGANSIALRDDSIENHKLNGLAAITLNYNGYNGGTTQFRDTRIFNGKQSQIAHFDGTTGYVGIGTSSPQQKLHVEGAMRLTASALPGSPAAGDIAIDSGDGNKLKYFDGSSWQTAGSSSGSGTTWQMIGRVQLSSAGSSIPISGLNGNADGTYKITYKIIHNQPLGTDEVLLRINNDSGNNYSYNGIWGDGGGGSASSSSGTRTGMLLVGGSANINTVTTGEILLNAETGVVRTAVNKINQSENLYTGITANNWTNTASNITSLEVMAPTANFMKAGSYIEVWTKRTNTSAGGGWTDDGSNIYTTSLTRNVGIGTSSPGQKLSVAGTIESTSGGVKFPDATTQTTAYLGPVVVRAQTNNGFSASADIVWEVENIDSANAYNTGNGRFTAPVTGYYRVSISVHVLSHTVFDLYKNGNPYSRIVQDGSSQMDSGSDVIYLTSGDYITLRNVSAGVSLQGCNAYCNFMSIEKIN